MNLKRYFIIIVLAVFTVSCGSKKKVVTKRDRSKPESQVVMEDTSRKEMDSGRAREERPANFSGSVEDYIRYFAPIAQEEMALYKIPASITLAQGILESGAGKGELSRRANNHFGIKCHDWNGPRVYHDDDARGECFRKYKDPKYSFRDHSLFLSERRRYAFLFDLDKDDYKGWAKGLRKAGYATDRRYPDKLIGLIERYELYRYDTNVSDRPSSGYTYSSKKDADTHVVQKGDTLYSIAKRYNTSVEQIKEHNDLSSNTIEIGQLLYIISEY
ncbi:glucosaminidase domain-containing protein [Salegentibacter chungangensis]|uniref:Peptidoglycan hydrolase n=1 Tax=Salegentibacter chungangensis TaxID=1335724 RepID=A0ABW3NN84_9FLAO